MIICNPSEYSMPNLREARPRLMLHYGEVDSYDLAPPPQPLATTTTAIKDDLPYHVDDRKPKIRLPIELR